MITTRHRWNHDATQYLAAGKDGNERTVRTCKQCGMQKITVHPPEGFPWHEWRTKDGHTWQGESTPPCLDDLNPKPEVVSETTAEVIAV